MSIDTIKGKGRISMRFNIRKAVESDATDIAKVQVDSWRTTYKGIVSDDYLAGLDYKNREEVWKNVVVQNATFLLLDDKDQTIGFAVGGPERSEEHIGYDGELYAIYLYEDVQGKGGGKQLFDAVVGNLVERGFESMIIIALEDNSACGFYEKMGGSVIGKEETDIAGENLTELVFGWKDIREI